MVVCKMFEKFCLTKQHKLRTKEHRRTFGIIAVPLLLYSKHFSTSSTDEEVRIFFFKCYKLLNK